MLNPPEYCLLWTKWEPMCMPRAEWAAWLQALGPVAAFAFAWLLFRLQRQDERQRAELLTLQRIARERRVLAQTLRDLVQTSTAVWSIGSDAAITADHRDAVVRVFRDILEALERVDLHAAENVRLIDSLGNLKAHVRDVVISAALGYPVAWKAEQSIQAAHPVMAELPGESFAQ